MQFDYIVVGSGSAGSPVAARLLERGASVLLIEAGKKEKIHLSRIPAAIVHTIGNPRYDWCYKTEADPTRGGLTEAWPRGKVPGGSSTINGMIFIRGAARDYDAWEAMGNPGWGWNDVLPYFRKMETADEGADNSLRGGLGPQRVSALGWRHSASSGFIEACEALGMPFSPDLNGASHEGVGWNQGSIRRGRRQSSWDAFIKPKLGDPKFRFIDETVVRKVLFDGRRATGVAVTRYGQDEKFTARKGVVLSAGAINSPHLLMLSGIGDPSHLKDHGIAPLIASPEVGQNLMEHPGLYIQAELNVPTANSRARPIHGAIGFAQWLLKGTGVMSVPSAQVLAFFRSQPELDEPDLQFHLFPIGSKRINGRLEIPNKNLVTILVNVNHPKSRGHLQLKSADPMAPIAIHPRLLEHVDDFEGVLRGLDWVRKVASTRPFSDYVVRLNDTPA